MSIKKKILLAIAAAVLITVAGMFVVASIEMRGAFQNYFGVSGKAQLERMESFVDNFFDNAMANAQLLVNAPLVRDNILNITSYAETTEDYKPIGANLTGNEYQMYLDLQRLIDTFPSYALTYVGNKNGGFVQAPDDVLTAGYNPPDRGWYKDAVRAGKALVTEAYISDNGDLVCTVAAPVSAASGGGYDGVVGFDIGLDVLTQEVGGVKVGKTGFVLMLDASRQVVVDPTFSGPAVPEQNRWLGKTVDQLPADAATMFNQLLAAQGDSIQEVTLDDKEWFAAVQKTRSNWVMIMLQEKAEVYADALELSTMIFIVGGIIVLLMLVMAWFVASSISRPVVILSKAAQAVAEGDLKAIPNDEKPFNGEVGVLHKSLKSMVGKLGELIGTSQCKMQEAEEALNLSRKSLREAEEAKKQAEQARREGVLQAVERLESIIGQLSDATKNLEEESVGAEKLADHQRCLVGEATESIKELTLSVDDVTASTSRTAGLAEDARTEADTGKTLVLQVVSSMGKIEQNSLEMQSSMGELGKRASDIGQIMSVINDIADQTNLLALNAAIEAARAGEAGRGFAVVADEVRKLAEKTMEATKQVGGAIETIQKSTEMNMQSMQHASEFISASTDVTNKAGEALARIEEMVANTANEVRAIATASEKQSATIEEINQNTVNIEKATSDVAVCVESSHEAVTDLVKLSDNLARIVQDMRKI